MSSIPAAKEWLTALHADLCLAALPTTAAVFTASGPKASHVADAVAEVLAELSRLEEENEQRRLVVVHLREENAKLRAERDAAREALRHCDLEFKANGFHELSHIRSIIGASLSPATDNSK